MSYLIGGHSAPLVQDVEVLYIISSSEDGNQVTTPYEAAERLRGQTQRLGTYKNSEIKVLLDLSSFL